MKMGQLEIQPAYDGGEYTGLYDVTQDGRILLLERSRNECESYVKEYNLKMNILEPLITQISPQQCRNIVSTYMKTINETKARKRRTRFSFFDFIMGRGSLLPGGMFDKGGQ